MYLEWQGLFYSFFTDCAKPWKANTNAVGVNNIYKDYMNNSQCEYCNTS